VPYDLIVVGGGAVGTSLARAARGLRVVQIASEPAPSAPAEAAPFDARIYMLSPGNVEFLRAIGAWQALDPGRVCPVRAMKVFGDAPGAEIEFDAYRSGVSELAWTVEDPALQAALRVGLQIESGKCSRLECDARRATLELSDGRRLEASLVVGADGAASFVRTAAGIEVRERSYGQIAVVANFACSKAHGQTAFQWFQGGAVLALLPLAGGQASMVWSLPDDEARRIAALPAGELARQVEKASAGVLGALEVTTGAKTFVLRRIAARRLVGQRVALVGDAAHVIHPLAGQGLNLGLQDARALAGVLAQREPVREIGDPALLRRYERSRAEPILAMDAAVDGLYRLFGASGTAARRLRNAGLNLTDRLPVLKNVLIRHAID
jgi:ubiquinone biosynthesis UbiH/UbiF/VisC/COQ6 family hydroxylase